MPIAAGTKLGPYEIQSAIGAGGMGEVYRAKDVRLNRIVAIKVLPSHLSENPQLKQRFEREAQAISSLSHPNICAIYDVGHQNGIEYLVMEFLEGESLAARLDKGAIPAEQVLRYGIQIAEALDKAHRQGIVHRDLKPGNVMITKSGAKLLDFGLARYSEARVPSDGSALETRDRALTEEGMVLGTVQYMAPEQLEGRAADERTDIFALGNVLYEMTTGRKAFSGTSKAGLMSAILSSEPSPISVVQPLAPVALDRLVRKCLAKDADDRWQNARDVASELKWIGEDTSRPSTAVPVIIRRKHIERYAFLALLLLLAGLSAYLIATRNPKDSRILKVTVLPPEKTRITGHLVLSHDGKKIAYVAKSIEGETSLWVRFLDSLQPKKLPGTEDAALPFWSPDDRFLGFFAQGKLKKIDISEGPPQSLADAPAGRGGTWNKDGVILFAPNFTGTPLFTVSSEGGPVAQATRLSGKDNTNRFPWFLPDGKHFLYVTRTKEGGESGVFISELGSNESKFLLPYVYNVQYVPQGYLVFLREKNLVARPFNLKTSQFTGDALSIGDKIGFDGASYSFSVSDNNVLSYSNVDLVNTKLVWLDRSGKELSSVGDAGAYIEPWFSPDEKQVVISRTDTATGHTDVWTVDLARQNFTRFTFTDANEYGALWSPDGSRIVYSSSRGGNFDLYQKVSNGAGSDELLYGSDHAKFADDWSPDGRYILIENEDPKSKYDLWILPTFGDKKPKPYLQTDFNEAHGQFSPDGKWVAYGSDEIGRTEIYVRPFPNASSGKWQVSTGGGDQPSWRKDGKELYYLAPDGRLMAVDVELDGSFKAGVPKPLFQTNVTPQPLVGSDRNQYRASADGQRFLVNTLPPEATYSGITVIFNWTSALVK
jgi:serine/threonine protein kinase